MYEKIKRWHEKGFWNDQMVLNAVEKKVLSQEQANEILGIKVEDTPVTQLEAEPDENVENIPTDTPVEHTDADPVTPEKEKAEKAVS